MGVGPSFGSSSRPSRTGPPHYQLPLPKKSLLVRGHLVEKGPGSSGRDTRSTCPRVTPSIPFLLRVTTTPSLVCQDSGSSGSTGFTRTTGSNRSCVKGGRRGGRLPQGVTKRRGRGSYSPNGSSNGPGPRTVREINRQPQYKPMVTKYKYVSLLKDYIG